TPSRRGPALLAEQLLDLLRIGGGNHHVVREASGLTRAALLELVHVAGPLAHDLPGPGDPEPLLGTGVRLVLRHSSLSSSLPGWCQPAVLVLPALKARASRRRCLRRLLLLVRPEHHGHVPAVLAGQALHVTELGHILGQPFQQAHAHLRSGLLPTAEHDHHLDLVPALEEPLDVPLLGAVVVRVDLDPEPDLLEGRVRMLAPCITSLHVGLVLVLAVVHELGHRRARIGGHLDQVEICLLGQPKRVLDTDDAYLLTVRADQTDLWHANPLVDTGLADVVLLTFKRGCDTPTRRKPPHAVRAEAQAGVPQAAARGTPGSSTWDPGSVGGIIRSGRAWVGESPLSRHPLLGR